MKTVSFQQFTVTKSPALNFHDALEYCREQGVNRLVVEPGVYEVDALLCSQRNLAISNHGHNGPKRIAAVIENMEDFEIDFSGSTLVCSGIMTPIAILNSRNITIRNLKLKNPTVPMVECRVTGCGGDYVDVECLHGRENVTLRNGSLFGEYPCSMLAQVNTNIEFDGTTGEIAAGTTDHTLGTPCAELRFEALDENHLRIFGVKRKPPVGNVLVFTCVRRVGTAIFCQHSHNLRFDHVDICSCYGMGLLAQICSDISLNSFNTVREDGCLCTASADATHFVNCSGLITVENSTFVGQMDDALNIHGIYTRILDKGEDWVLVREMHPEATGIPIYQPGNTVQVLPADTLLPYTRKTIREVEVINDSCMRVYLAESAGDIRVGDDLENITLNADLIFRNNIVRDNRARGMLIGTRGKVLIENCTFRTRVTAIKFESDGAYWFESGGTTDVTIRGNCFDHCNDGWGTAVIECQPREATEENRYFHGSIQVLQNHFEAGVAQLARIDNTAEFRFLDNTFTEKEAYVTVTHVGSEEIQDGILVAGK